MPDTRLLRISRELFLAAFGVQQQNIDFWVIDRLISLMDEEYVQAGQIMAVAGEALEYIYFMQEGSVRLTQEGRPPWTFNGRWVLGAYEAHLDRPLVRTSTALADFRAMKIRTSAWIELLEDSFLLARSTVRFSSAVVARLDERVPGGLPKPEAEFGRSSSSSVRPPSQSPIIERLAFLSEVDMLKGAGVQPLAELAVAAREVAFASGDVVLEHGPEHQQIFVVIEGEVHAKHDGSEATWRYGPREIVCGAAAFGGAPGWEVRAACRTRAVSFPIEAWFELMDEHFDMVRAAVSSLGLRREALLNYLAEQDNGLVLT